MKIELIDVDGFNGKYVISRDGYIYSTYKNFFSHGVLRKSCKLTKLKPSLDKRGYLVVNLHDDNGNVKAYKLHRLVAQAFLPNLDNKRCVCHIDNDKTNCCVDNLYWGTDLENNHQARQDRLYGNEQPIGQYKLDGTLIAIYPSQSEASRKNGISQSNLWKCIEGKRKTTGGYIWRRLD